MTIYELYDSLIDKFTALPEVKASLNEPVIIRGDAEPEPQLLPWNYVPFKGKRPEYRVCALFKGRRGEAYTETPRDFEGTLKEAIKIPPTDHGIDAVTVSVINAVMNHLGLCAGSFPADFDERRLYTDALYSHIYENYGKSNIILVGYDGYIIKKFVSEEVDFWTMDRDPDHISQDRFKHVVVNSGRWNREACFAWGKLFLVTGSTLCNGTIIQYLDLLSKKDDRQLLFHGITIAGAARLLDLPWFEVLDKGF